jgi:hypothetical protein
MEGQLQLSSFDSLAGVPLYYARLPPQFPYGSKGQGPRTCRLAPKFKDELEACLYGLWKLHPWGTPARIIEGGCYVEKAGRHGEGRAIDIDALWWEDDRHLITRDAISYPVHYLGIEACLRLGFGTVLDFWFGHGHEDHWHVDNGQPQGFSGQPPTAHAETIFLQASLIHVHGAQLKAGIDGILGPETMMAFAHVTEPAGDGCTRETIKLLWNAYLQLTAEASFKQI